MPGRLVAVAVAVLVGATACQDGAATEPSPAAADPPVTAEVVQLRRDQVLQRVEVALTNLGDERLVVERLRLEVAGFRMPGAIRKDSPIAAGLVVNLPVPYLSVHCPDDGPPRVGPPRVTLQVHTASDPTTRTVAVDATDGDGLLHRIAARACAVQRVQRDVDLRFADGWRLEATPDGDVLHGTLEARLRRGSTRTVTQVAGAILYGLRPDSTADSPLATLTPARPAARVPVVAFAARCDGHTIGEIKKPYEFLVWVAAEGGEEVAVTPEVGSATKAALRQVCSF